MYLYLGSSSDSDWVFNPPSAKYCCTSDEGWNGRWRHCCRRMTCRSATLWPTCTPRKAWTRPFAADLQGLRDHPCQHHGLGPQQISAPGVRAWLQLCCRASRSSCHSMVGLDKLIRRCFRLTPSSWQSPRRTENEIRSWLMESWDLFYSKFSHLLDVGLWIVVNFCWNVLQKMLFGALFLADCRRVDLNFTSNVQIHGE